MTVCRAVTALAVVASLCGAANAGSAVAAPLFVVTGAGSATAELTVTSTMTIDYGDAVVTGTGRYAGLAIWSASGRSFGGVVAIPGLDSPTSPVAAGVTTRVATLATTLIGTPVARLVPGRYRVHLLGDGATEVRVPVRDGDGMTLRADTPAVQGFSVTHATARAQGSGVTARRALAVRRTTKYVVVARFGPGAASRDVRVVACVTRRNTTCAGGVVVQMTSTGGTAVGATQSGVGFRGTLVGGAARDARAEVTYSGTAGGTLALAVVSYDLAV